MTKRMLIDGTHPEEVRVVITSANRLEEYDVETSTKRQLKGNIYLAKVTRVEPSLQAAFVDFGGDRHGFLAFNDIHPDYFQIPVEDREALVAAENAEGGNEATAQALVDEIDSTVEDISETERPDADEGDPVEDEPEASIAESAGSPEADTVATEPMEEDAPEPGPEEPEAEAEDSGETAKAGAEAAEAAEDGSEPETGEGEETAGEKKPSSSRRRRRGRRRGDSEGNGESRPPSSRSRRYKIQEVIKRNQIILVQVVKEERGNKGAALTTYISLAGRYCVLMPNTARGGGISRKITNPNARRKLKKIIEDLEIQNGMGVIMRTAGTERSKAEIRRDFEYLSRTWDDVRDRTFSSNRSHAGLRGREPDKARDPRPLHQGRGGSARRRGGRLSDRQEIHADDDAEPRQARPAIPGSRRPAIPPPPDRRPAGRDSQRRRAAQVGRLHRDPGDGSPGLDRRELGPLDARTQYRGNRARHQCRSGGGNRPPTQVARLGGAGRHRFHRHAGNAPPAPGGAPAQRGDEIGPRTHPDRSNQRLRAAGTVPPAAARPSLQEASTQTCPHCRGAGFIRSTESMALQVLRALEEEGTRHNLSEVTVSIPSSVALYVLNNKRTVLSDIENRYGFRIALLGDDSVVSPDMRIERVRAPVSDAGEKPAAAEGRDKPAKAEEAAPREEGEKKRSRRRRSRRKSSPEATAEAVAEETADTDRETGAAEAGDGDDEGAASERRPSRRRAGRRGGRRRSGRGSKASEEKSEADSEPDAPTPPTPPSSETDEAGTTEPDPVPEPPAAPPQEPVPAARPAPEVAAVSDPEPAPVLAALAIDDTGDAPAPPEAETDDAAAIEDPDRPKRRGWWQKMVK